MSAAPRRPRTVDPVFLRLDRGPLVVLLPRCSRPPDQTFSTYSHKLRHSHDFDGQADAVAKLAAIPAQLVERPQPSAAIPTIGILIAEPRGMLPENDTTIVLVRLVNHVGGWPVLIPPRTDLLMPSRASSRGAVFLRLVAELDGLLGPGGDDVDPRIYGQPPELDAQGRPYSRDTNYRRDRCEAEFARFALRAELFAFGICRSHQLWNAALGGDLVQDVRAAGYSEDTQNQEELQLDARRPFVERDQQGRVVFENRVFLKPHSRIQTALGNSVSLMTNSLHHQAVKIPGHGLEVVGAVRDPRTGRDTIEITEGWNVITTQFHPELMRSDGGPHHLLDLMGRRAHIFALVRRLRAQGVRPTLARLTAAMKRQPALGYVPADLVWVEKDLLPRLTRA